MKVTHLVNTKIKVGKFELAYKMNFVKHII